jgi:2-hydroxychromene-2-carboxylate isomerase
MQNDCELVSMKNNTSFTWNAKFPINTLLIMRGYLHTEENQKKNYLDTFFDAYWKNNIDLSSENEILKLLKILQIDSVIFFKGIKEQYIKDHLKDLTNNAFRKEVFGAPTFIVNNKIFWGQDRLQYALDEINAN